MVFEFGGFSMSRSVRANVVEESMYLVQPSSPYQVERESEKVSQREREGGSRYMCTCMYVCEREKYVKFNGEFLICLESEKSTFWYQK